MIVVDLAMAELEQEDSTKSEEIDQAQVRMAMRSSLHMTAINGAHCMVEHVALQLVSESFRMSYGIGKSMTQRHECV